ncbi:hypothetical protein O6H91_06G029300 [Diphasiastrum complanatum]|uniref:Uncharacterized protein n=1 Tax=Diphasiastrum complanatum TaxID=34168 RepID=A0ACC2DBZ4_DIPCM|nr:hypothetical protein O6H91_Y185900 [Diphasiastrum complanatum]KAJ7551805.1 hypothetical protein O6H91_06G029300 [Diphasiastrum complanatum]
MALSARAFSVIPHASYYASCWQCEGCCWSLQSIAPKQQLSNRPKALRSLNRARKCKIFDELEISRNFFVKATLATGMLYCASALAETSTEHASQNELEMLPYKREGYNYWMWRGHKVHYVVKGEGRPVVLIHGFGASTFHWRYNIPELAKHFKVYAMDLLGFGLSEKALIDYNPFVWRDQVADFVQEIVAKPAVLVGNSIGGFTVLLTAAAFPQLTSGLVLLNASGQFEVPDEQKKPVIQETALQRLVITPLITWARRWAILFTFWQAKQPSRIRSVLNNVYVDRTNVDDNLVQSIVTPAQEPNAAEVYYRMMTQFLSRPSDITLNKLLAELSCPLMLLWGDLDPWMGATKAEKIKQLYDKTLLVRLQAGHCPHDEAPKEANQALVDWISSLV